MKVKEEQVFNIGDAVYRISPKYNAISKVEIIDVECYGHYVYKTSDYKSFFSKHVSKTVFKTRKEAEEMLNRLASIKIKRNKLKQYEQELNEELNITDHILIK